MTPTNPLFRRAPSAPPAGPNPFERYGLKRNPFPNLPGVIPENDDPRINGSIYQADLRHVEQEKFDRLLIPTPGHPDAGGMAFLMDCATRFGRGVGKTAFLNHQRQRIMTDLGNQVSQEAHVLFASYVLPPSDGRCRKFWQFCRLVFEHLNEQGILAQAVWRLRHFSGRLPDPVLTRIGNDPQKTIGENSWLDSQGVNVDFDLTPTVKRMLVSEGVSEPLAEELALDGHSPEAFRAGFLRRQTEHVWRRQGGPWLFDELVRVFRKAQFTGGLHLVDDFERIVVHQSARERLSFVEDLRYYFIEGPFENVRHRFYSALWTIHPYVQELLVSHWQQVGLERFCALGGELAAEHTIDFRPLEAQAAVPLVLAYLNCSRLREEDYGQLGPFDRDGLVEALRLVKGLPGYLLALLSRVMDHAVRKDWPSIDGERIREVYKEEPPLPAEGEEVRAPLPPVQVDLRAEE
jgi:hypothetical protein